MTRDEIFDALVAEQSRELTLVEFEIIGMLADLFAADRSGLSAAELDRRAQTIVSLRSELPTRPAVAKWDLSKLDDGEMSWLARIHAKCSGQPVPDERPSTNDDAAAVERRQLTARCGALTLLVRELCPDLSPSDLERAIADGKLPASALPSVPLLDGHAAEVVRLRDARRFES